MNSFMLYAIYLTAAFFFLRFLYLHSFRDVIRRKAFSQAILRMLVFIPAGMQGILIFCYAIFQLIFITGFAGNHFSAALSPLKIIFTGSLLLTANLLFAKAAAKEKGTSGFFYKLIVLAAGLCILSLLVSNMRHELFFSRVTKPIISYTNNFLFILSSLLILVFAFLKGEWIYSKQSDTAKYFSLASRLLLLFTCVLIIGKIVFNVHAHTL